MNYRLLLLLTFIAILVDANCQDTLSVDWQRNVCASPHIDQVYDITSDSNGNVYTLGSFPNYANSMGQALNDSTGSYFLTKLDSLGNLIYTVNFGSQDYLTFGKLELSNNDNLIIGLNFKGDFFYDGNIVTSNANHSSLLMKLDSNLNLIWHVKIPSGSYLNGLTQDESQNIYTTIQFIDSIEINGTVYTSQGGAYSFLVTKFDSNGNDLWSRNYQCQPGNMLNNKEIKYYQKGDNSGVLLLTGQNTGDTLFIDGTPQLIKDSYGTYVSKIDVNGNILESKHYRNVEYIIDFSFYDDRIFCAGTFIDTVNWLGSITAPIGNRSAFICELNQISDIIDFKDLSSSESLYLTDFTISEYYGYLICGSYSGSMSIQSSSITLGNQSYKGAIVASFDQSYILNDSKYIIGGFYNLRKIDVSDDIVYGAGVYRSNCDFENYSFQAANDDISVFRTNDILPISNFGSSAAINDLNIQDCAIQIYPNPTRDILKIDMLPLAVLSLTTIDGRDVTNINVVANTSGTEIDFSNVESGVYFLNILDCNENLQSIRIKKIN
jgi:hypothetical protein